MNIYSFPAIISFTINFSIALIILLNKSKNVVNKWFASFIFSFALWNVSEILILNSKNLVNALLWAQILYRIIFLAPAFFLIIAYLFPRNFSPFAKKAYFPVLVFALPILLLIFSFPNFQITLISLSQYKQIYYYKISFANSLSFILLSIVFMGYSLWGSLILIYKIPRLRTSREKRQTRFLLVGVLSIFILLIIINAVRSSISNELSFYFLSTILVLFISIFFLLSIVQYKFFKITRLISHGISYSIISSIILAIYFLIVKALSESLLKYLGSSSAYFEVILILLIVLLIGPLENRIRLSVDRLLYRDINQYRHHFMAFSRELLDYMDSDHFFQKIKHFLIKEFQVNNVYIFIKDENTDMFIPSEKDKNIPSIKLDDPLIKSLSANKRATELYELHIDSLSSHIYKFLEKNHIEILIPLIMESEILAIIMLPSRKLKREYTEEIQEILTILGNEFTTAYHRNLMFEKIRKEEQQKFRVEHLAALGQLTAGVAHEIRNPLNTISTAAETLLKRELSPEDEKELKTYILEEAGRLNNILSDFLNLSRLKPPVITAVNIDDIIDQVFMNLESRSKNNIKLKKKSTKALTEIQSDPQLLYQAVLNLALNALEAIEIRCREDEAFGCDNGEVIIGIRRQNGDVYISISDNGVEIDQENAEKIIDPFFTTKENGTGLGLSITHNIIQALNGSLQFSSHKDQTTFTIRLPQGQNLTT